MTGHGIHGTWGTTAPVVSADSAARTGVGRAHGAVTILNATATGIGCALAVEAGASAHWSWQGDRLILHGAPDEKLARAVQQQFGGRGATVSSTTHFAPTRGLKTSSSAATAMLRAAHDASGTAPDDVAILRAAVCASRQAAVTLTGALDDQAAVSLGGCHLTDNRRDAVLQTLPAERWHVAVWVPDAAIDKAQVARIDASPAAKLAREAEHLAARGRLPDAMTRNGEAYTRLYAAAGLPVDDRPAHIALEHGALGAGLSGTGPAVAALFQTPTKLPGVPGGIWTWTRAVEAAR